MPKKFNFYNIRHLLTEYPDCQYYMAYGERSNGKTYSSLDYALEKNSKTGEQFAYVRRWGMDIKRKEMTELFSGHIQNKVVQKYYGDKWNSISFVSGKFYLSNYDENGDRELSEDPIGFVFDLNSMEHYKSVSYPRVTTIIFDEFLSRNGYLPNEFILFTNMLSTIIRHRNNVKILMLGNTVNKYCPYFSEMGLSHVKDQKPGTVNVYTYGDSKLQVCVEYTLTGKKEGGKESDIYFAFDNPELKMITGGEWEIAIYPHLETKYKPKDVALHFFIQFEGETLHGEIVAVGDSAPFIFFHRKTTPIKNSDDYVYGTVSSTRPTWKMCLTKQTDKLSAFINKATRENRIFYSENEVGEIYRNYIMWSNKYSITN